MGNTIFTLNDVNVQVILPQNFKLVQVNKAKKNLPYINYANAGYFAKLGDGTVTPVGNLVIGGKTIVDAAHQANWLSSYNKEQTTIVVHTNNALEMIKVKDMSSIPNVKYAISGLPILRGGWNVSRNYKTEGYTGSEMYTTWHTFLGIRGDKLVVVGAKCSPTQMPFLMEVLGLNDSIKLDGGGSFIMKSDSFVKTTAENRRIDNIITW